jgi:D-alanyl-D-alanine carboxypeptidase (penicillin-binding protein 5/6)
MRLHDLRRYVMTKQTSFPGGRVADGKLEPGFPIANHNQLLFSYRGAIGIKNGYPSAAKFTYVEAAPAGTRRTS